MRRFKLKMDRFFLLPSKNCVFLTLIWIIAIRAAEYNGKEYYYDYYDEYPVNGGKEYLDENPSAVGKYYVDGETKQNRPKKELSAKDMNWINKPFASLSEPECAPVTPAAADASTTESSGKSEQTTCLPVTSTKASETEKPNLAEDCAPTKMNCNQGVSGPPQSYRAISNSNELEQKSKELRNMVQRLYIAQARVQLEASEIKKAQAIANEAQQQLEESANHVRAITAALQNAQQEVASAAIRAQTAQLQLAAHDQLLFAARQDVDALSSQMVGLQAAEGIAQPKANLDISALMNKLRQPLQPSEKPTPVPPINAANYLNSKKKKETSPEYYYTEEYVDY